MKVFISGPMRGYPDGNRDAFLRRARELAARGHQPVSPWDLPVDHDSALQCIGERASEHRQPTSHGNGCFLRAGLAALLRCDAITLLSGWADSAGARIEVEVARAVGLGLIRAPLGSMPLQVDVEGFPVGSRSTVVARP